MDNNIDTSLHSRTTSRSLLSLTPYETWQLNKYGNYYKEREQEEIEDDLDQVQIMQDLLYNH